MISGSGFHFIQNVHKVTFIEENADYVAIKTNRINKSYNVFHEETWMGKRSILQDILILYKTRTENNNKKLFEKFIQKWGFVNNSAKQSMKEFWDVINFIGLFLSRYSQIMNKELTLLKIWINVKEARSEVLKEINGVVYSIENTETLLAKSGVKTIVSFNCEIKCGSITSTSSLKEIKQNELANYQLFGFTFLLVVLDELNIQSTTKTRRVSAQQRNAYTPIDEIKLDTFQEVKDMKTSLYTLLMILVTKEQSVCKSCGSPFTPKRANNIYCSNTCSDYIKKKNYRERKKHKIT